MDTNKNIEFEHFSATDQGQLRSQNEDAFGSSQSPLGHVFALCDGMGGHVAGEEASRLAIEHSLAAMKNITDQSPENALKQAIEQANRAIVKHAAQKPQLRGMGTTIVLVLIAREQLFYAHVGDSRLYVFTKDELFQLTKDHTQVQQLLDMQVLSHAQAREHPRRHVLTQAVGTESHIDVSVCQRPVKAEHNDIFLLCSDGLTDMVAETEIETVLRENTHISAKGEKLVRLANEYGGNDNITLTLIEFMKK